MTVEAFQANEAKELIPMRRESFELGVGIKDPHPIAERENNFWTVVVPTNAIMVAFLED